MSMSQEEIEALMNGLDIEDEVEESSDDTESETLSMDEIENLVLESQGDEDAEIKDDSSEDDEEFDLDSLVNEFSKDMEDDEDSSEEISNDDIDALINSTTSSNKESLEDLASVISEIDAKDEDEDIEKLIKEEPKAIIEDDPKKPVIDDSAFQSWADTKINQGIMPIPAENDAKVVNQLSQVANDSEEKVSQIFDVLSSTLDTNNDIRGILKHTNEVLEAQTNLLNTLSVKFPNVGLFASNLEQIQTLGTDISKINEHLMNEDNQIFQAMELMQFNDINRQKIERVMSVIRKLSIYLNNLFEDEHSMSKEIVTAKHIHGDDNEVVTGDDLEKLIDEFNKRV